LTLHRQEKDFSLYQLEETIEENYVRRVLPVAPKTLNTPSQSPKEGQEAENPENTAIIHNRKVLAIPAKNCFEKLYQVATKISDSAVQRDKDEGGRSKKSTKSAKRDEEIEALSQLYLERLQAKLLGHLIAPVNRNKTRSSLQREAKELLLSEDDETMTDIERSSSLELLQQQDSSSSSQLHTDLILSDGLAALKPEHYSGQGSGTWKPLAVTPNPGFVIKTWKENHPEEKVFINVFHHEALDALLENEGYLLPDELQPFMAFGNETSDFDNHQKKVPVYEVLVGSSHFLDSYINTEKKITDEERVGRIIEAVNERFRTYLDPSDFVLPRIHGGCKGEWAETITFYYRLPSRQYQLPNRRRPSGGKDWNVGELFFFGSRANSSRTISKASLVSESSDSGNAPSVKSSTSVASKTSNVSNFFGSFSSHALQAREELALTDDMFVYKPKESLDWQDVVILKHYSTDHPQAILGYQITRLSLGNKPAGQ
jgi:hypothetical protein